jgi:hypothetical protein
MHGIAGQLYISYSFLTLNVSVYFWSVLEVAKNSESNINNTGINV